MHIDELIQKVKSYEKEEKNIELIKKAYNFAKKAHKDQFRASGKPFIWHPLAVASILADLKLDALTIAAGLLHDVVEDTNVSLDEIKKEFGEKIASLVDGVTNLNKYEFRSMEEYHAESLRKVILASIKDIRILFIRLADKLHNMQTLEYFRKEKQKRIAKEAMEIYAPIAYRLGICSIKWQLEDLAFKYLHPEIYEEISQKIKKSMEHREKEIEKIIAVVRKELEKHGKKDVIIKGRPKHIYSIYRKMQRKKCSFEEIYDVVGIRIITKTVKDCYEILGIIHNMWKPIPKEFDDYIAMPKSNMYQSLHTVVIGEGGQPIEIQIRTEEMDNIAENGIAAHWRYKGVCDNSEFDNKLNWLKEVLEWKQSLKDYKEFLEMLHIDLFEDEIFTFTPKGKVIELPKGSCVIDFAYAVHSELGERAIGAKVNGKFVPLKTVLKNGDIVEVITSKTQRPSRDWLKYVKTSRARSKIKQYIRSVEKIPVSASASVGEEKKELEEWIISVSGITNPKIKLSKCCNPLPGDQIVGLASKVGRVMIHKKNCKLIKGRTRSLRKFIVHAEWVDKIGPNVEITVRGLNRVGLFVEILNAIISTKTNIKKANAKSAGELIECSFLLESRGIDHLKKIISLIKNLNGVKKVYLSKKEEKKN